MAQYIKDPRWTTAKFNGSCSKCGNPVGKGEKIFYFPRTKTVLCSREGCGKEASKQFELEKADEEQLSGARN